MARFIDEFYYGNIDLQVHSTNQALTIKSPGFSGRFFVSSDINPLRDFRYAALRLDMCFAHDMPCGRWGISLPSGNISKFCNAELYRICQQANISRFAPQNISTK